MSPGFIPEAVIKYPHKSNFQGERICMRLQIPVPSLLLEGSQGRDSEHLATTSQ